MKKVTTPNQYLPEIKDRYYDRYFIDDFIVLSQHVLMPSLSAIGILSRPIAAHPDTEATSFDVRERHARR